MICGCIVIAKKSIYWLEDAKELACWILTACEVHWRVLFPIVLEEISALLSTISYCAF
jgi:hypothetical protein